MTVFSGNTLDVPILTSYVKAFESSRLTDIQTDRQTDTAEIIYHAASRVVKLKYKWLKTILKVSIKEKLPMFNVLEILLTSAGRASDTIT